MDVIKINCKFIFSDNPIISTNEYPYIEINSLVSLTFIFSNKFLNYEYSIMKDNKIIKNKEHQYIR